MDKAGMAKGQGATVLQVRLFVREAKRGPFRYEGEMQFAGWEGDRPITVRWGRSSL